MTPSLGVSFIASIVQVGSVEKYLGLGTLAHLFKNPQELALFGALDAHVKKYGKVPEKSTLEGLVKDALPPEKEPPEFHLDRLRNRFVEMAMKDAVTKASDFLMPGKSDPMKAFESLLGDLMGVYVGNHSREIVDFRSSLERIYADYKAKMIMGDEFGIQLGYPTLDAMTGGLIGGDLVSYVGRPAMGKTFQLLFSALHVWLTQQKPVVFLSMEMKPILIEQRLAAMHTHIPLSQIKNADLTTKALQVLMGSLKKLKEFPVPFHVADGNLASTVDDAVALFRQLGAAAGFVDGAYLFKHLRERDRYKRVAENCDLLKQASGALGIPLCCTWQFAKEASKKAKKGEKAGLEDIGYSDAIAQHSSVVLGLFEEEGVETIKQRRVDILKGRSGEVGFFRTNWDFQTMDFREISKENLQELTNIG